MNEIGDKQCQNIKRYILDNLDKRQCSDRPTYNYMIPIGNNFIYIRIRKSSIVIRIRRVHLTTYDMDFYWALKYPKLTKLWDKVKSFIKKILHIQQGHR